MTPGPASGTDQQGVPIARCSQPHGRKRRRHVLFVVCECPECRTHRFRDIMGLSDTTLQFAPDGVLNLSDDLKPDHGVELMKPSNDLAGDLLFPGCRFVREIDEDIGIDSKPHD